MLLLQNVKKKKKKLAIYLCKHVGARRPGWATARSATLIFHSHADNSGTKEVGHVCKIVLSTGTHLER